MKTGGRGAGGAGAGQKKLIRELNLEVQRMVHVIRDCSFLVLSLSKFID
jgi:hypothetical protein